MNGISNNILDICHNYYKYLIDLENVVGLCIGHKKINTLETCLSILVEKKVDNHYLSQNNIIPKSYMGIKTDVVEVGYLKPYIGEPVIGKFRPLVSGCQIFIENPDNTYSSGTLGGFVYRTVKGEEEYYILSNNHVLSKYGKLPVGTPVVQSNSFSFSDSDVVAYLTSFIPIMSSDKFFEFDNEVDAAIAKVVDKELISKSAFRIGRIYGVNNAVLNEFAQKVGASTGHTEGKVIGLGATVKLPNTDGNINRFKNQIILKLDGAPGDSGSFIFNYKNEAIGLLIGGDSDTGVCYANDINIVLKKFKAKLYADDW